MWGSEKRHVAAILCAPDPGICVPEGRQGWAFLPKPSPGGGSLDGDFKFFGDKNWSVKLISDTRSIEAVRSGVRDRVALFVRSS